ncbi:LysR family transcriptional regulator, partial [Stenotrophomonas maltophilia]
PTRGARAG